ncbi:hypothetical protein RU97_GL001910 [Enterococcus canis]|uniref:WxL domain-containing protein n=1 Tax=Enterococcus canis TaxID=214095 RepID=A0A1L8RFK9_9ENTE|nr:hypothetical protein [Enterococcus canis]OJG18513.1 hypothetical protein RU97_GL001910 [Enterococcus canis]
MKKVFFPLLLLSLLGNITTTTSSSLATTEASTTETTTITTDSLLDTSLIEESLAESSTSESTQVSSSENITGGSGSGQSAGGESSESTVEKPKMQSLVATTSLDLATQDGSEGNPYLVATFAELQSAIDTINKKTDDSQSLYYIQLTADIEYTNKTTTLSKSTVINGIKDLEKDPADPDNHYSILYTTSSGYTSRHFEATGAVNITLKNINYGNEEYPNGNYWGIMRMNTAGSSLTVENIQYELTNGAQPFYADTGGISLTYKGDNSFVSHSGTYGGEFVEGFNIVDFSSGSKTFVDNDTSLGDVLFYGRFDDSNKNQMVVTIEKNASLKTRSSKNGLFWSGNPCVLNVEENGFFRYEKYKGDGGGSSNYINVNNNKITFNLSKNSRTELVSSSTAIDLKSMTDFNCDQPDYILIQQTDNRNVVASGKATFYRTDQDLGTSYSVNYLDSANTTNVFQGNILTSAEISNTSPANARSIIYEQDLFLSGVEGEPSTSNSESKIDVDITDYTPNDRTLSSVDYMLTKNQLYDVSNPITDSISQSAIDEKFQLEDASINKISVNPDENTPETNATFNNIEGGIYHLYAKVTGNAIGGISSSSLWVETTVNLTKVINTNIPVNMIFKSPTTEFGKAENVDEYEFINNSNIPIEVDLTEVAPTAESDSDVSLATTLSPTDTYKLLLNLATNYTDETNNPLVWGPLTEGPIPEDSKVMLLEPFWETDKNQAEVYLTGNYSGPVSEVKNVAYNFTFTIIAQEETENAN